MDVTFSLKASQQGGSPKNTTAQNKRPRVNNIRQLQTQRFEGSKASPVDRRLYIHLLRPAATSLARNSKPPVGGFDSETPAFSPCCSKISHILGAQDPKYQGLEPPKASNSEVLGS